MKLSLVVKFVTICICAMLCANAEAEFKAGFSKVDITPELGIPLSGYYRYRPADGVLDPLYTRCVAITDGTKVALIYSVDNIQVGEDIVSRVKERITKKTGVKEDAIFFACTHTHTGPVCWPRVAKTAEAKELVKKSNELIVTKSVQAAEEAIADLTPAKILIGRGEAKDISFVRRYKMKDGTYRTNPLRNDPDVIGPVGEPDETLQLVRFVRQGAKEIAIMNFQCHPDVISGNKISADWPGLSCKYLEDAFMGKVHAMLLNGAQGDVNHIRQRWKKGDFLPFGYAMAHHMARTVAGGAMKAWGFCTQVEAGQINTAVRRIKVRVNKGKPEDYPIAEKWQKLYKEGKANEIPGKGMERTVNIAWAGRVMGTRNWPDEKDIPVTVVAIGSSLAFGGFSGEPFTEMGRIIKQRSKFKMTMPSCCTGGSYGYFPMKDAFTVGGYENATSRYAKGTAESLVDGMLTQLDEFYDKAIKEKTK